MKSATRDVTDNAFELVLPDELDSDLCARCKDHAIFFRNKEDGTLYSECCSAQPTPVDYD